MPFFIYEFTPGRWSLARIRELFFYIIMTSAAACATGLGFTDLSQEWDSLNLSLIHLTSRSKCQIQICCVFLLLYSVWLFLHCCNVSLTVIADLWACSDLCLSFCLSVSAPVSETSPYEMIRSQELNALLGPKGSAQAVDLLCDLHNTTANTGLCLITYSDCDWICLHICKHLQARTNTSCAGPPHAWCLLG